MVSLPYADAATSNVDHLLGVLKTHSGGLTPDEAARRLKELGTNEVSLRNVTAMDVLARQFRSPFIYLLLVAMAVSLAVREPVDAAMIGAFLVINTFLGFYQEYRAEQAAKLLMRYWRDQARVFRDGKLQMIGSQDLVPGDIVRLQAGDRIPADVRLISNGHVSVDESILTGETAEVSKDAAPMDDAPGDLYLARNIGFAGTTVQAGEADAVVFATGRSSSLGDIVKLTGETTTVGAFEKGIQGFSKFILKLVGSTLVIVIGLNIGIKGVGGFQELVLFGIALTIGVIPEALPLVLTVVHSRAALQLAKRHVIVKRLSAIDDLGSVDVLCTDKTGTLTKNCMHVARVLSAEPDHCVRFALLGSSVLDGRDRRMNNPFDIALWAYASAKIRKGIEKHRKLHELPFDPVRRRNALISVAPNGERTLVVRGSPDEVLGLCTGVKDPIGIGRYLQEEGFAGRRVLAVAVKRHVAAEDVSEQDESDLEYIGLISFEDPLKEGAAAAVKKAASLGVQVKMLTGDAKEVAVAVALRLGLTDDPTHVLTGADFEALSSERKLAAVERIHVFARVNPRQKFDILALIRQRGASVGFLGEGFNDAPGLKMADVAIAVENASDVAKDAADVILTRKSLGAIVDGIEYGRMNFANIIKYLKITLASNFGNFYAVAISSLFIPFLPMQAVQILLLNLATDAPMIAVSTDAVAHDDLKRPSHYDVRGLIIAASVLGVVSTLFDFATFFLFKGLGEGPLQTLWFMESALTEIVLIFSVRTTGVFFRAPRVPRALGGLAIGIVAFTLAVPYTAVGRELFRFVAPTMPQLAAVLGLVAAYFVSTEVVKRWARKAIPFLNGAAH